MLAIRKHSPTDISNSFCIIFKISQVFCASFPIRRCSQSTLLFRLKCILQSIWMILYNSILSYEIILRFNQLEIDKPLHERILFETSHVTRLVANLIILITCLFIVYRRQLEQLFIEFRKIDNQIIRIALARIRNNSNSKNRFNMWILIAFASVNATITLGDYFDSEGQILQYLNSTAVYVLPNISLTLIQLQYVNFLMLLHERYSKINVLLELALQEQPIENISRHMTQKTNLIELEKRITELRLIHFRLDALHSWLTQLYGAVLCIMFLSISMELIIIMFEFFGIARQFEARSSLSISYQLVWIAMYNGTLLVVLITCERVSNVVYYVIAMHMFLWNYN